MSDSCRDLENLHYFDSWNRHCGGNWRDFTSRSIKLTDSLILAYVSGRLMWASKILGRSFGASFYAKSMNDMYEAWSGDTGLIRETLGDLPYTLFGYFTIGFGLFSRVPKLTYLGTPKRDLFVRDPLSYEFAFQQYSRIEFVHLGITTGLSLQEDSKKINEILSVEDAWNKHILMSRMNDE